MKESLGLGKKSFGTETETWSWFRLPIPKPGFGRTLLQTGHVRQMLADQVAEEKNVYRISLAAKYQRIFKGIYPFLYVSKIIQILHRFSVFSLSKC